MRLLTRGGSAALAATLALGGAVMLPAAAHAAPTVNDAPITLDHGHIDAFTPVLNDDGSLRLTLKEDVTPPGNVLRTPESVELFVKDAALLEFPEGFVPGLSGAAYHLPLTQDHNLIWPGWETQLIRDEYPGADTDIVVSEIDGPGQVFLWSQGGFGSLVSLLDGGGYELPATISQPYPAHTHAAWAFTEPGTYKLTVRADVTATNGNSGSTDTHVYTFVVAERTQLTPEAPTQSGNTVTIPEQKWISYTDAEGAPLAAGDVELTEDLEVRAHPAYGFALADGAPAGWSFDYEAPAPAPAVSIEGLKHHYHPGDTVSLTAVQEPNALEPHYHWFIRGEGQDDYAMIPGGVDGALSFEAEAGHHGAQIIVRLYGAGHAVVAESEPVVMQIEDHGGEHPVETTLSIEGLKQHYHTGDTMRLTAVQDPATEEDHYHWFIKRVGEDDFAVISGALSETLEHVIAEGDHGAQVIARLYDHDHALLAESEPVSIAVNDHHGEEPGTDEPGSGGSGTDEPKQQGPSGDGSRGGLANTGAQAPLTAGMIAAAVLLIGAGALLLERRRREAD